jgi:hypothetical protein
VRARLFPHPTTPDPRLRALTAEVRRAANGDVAIAYRLDGDLAAIALDAPAPPRFVLGLWERTCVEAFVALEGGEAYLEINVSPACEWTVLELRARRQRTRVRSDADAEPMIDSRIRRSTLALDVTLPLARLWPAAATSALRIGLSAVIASASGERSYWALRHPPGAPDFHSPESFALRLEPPQPR